MMEAQPRTCTMPWLPFGLRDKFTNKFNDLCSKHDFEYALGICKLCADWNFVKEIWRRGYWWLTPLVFLAVNLPNVWYSYIREKNKG